MRYHVFWHPDAELDLEALLRAATDAADLAAAARQIDRQLLRHAHLYGESRDADLRIAFEGPLCVLFDVFRDERTAVVYQIRRYG